ncbi:hypothetical protein ACOARL_13950 [Pseudomonas aeruginosa]|uniref:hypothetical protein n=1 Tax=Pseudomonas aeruginosa TaxID=287 RepID=UPI001F0C46EF|nr:hypothetical protein [Pseudomonas aeruginosa]MCP9251879.1 hypothetical protein [Pseudomonas aeruginosa]MDU0687010.1 hypothetical protein [Pseudomonas aeruginosa]UNT52463.1 hypothetical protein IBG29_12080 [Pseudomonas aeruginosa]HCE6035528.1 hypothetical protein [Pseudomonas aeruginosa]HCI2094714.1 hypothetical protein [Pseudomonas aeruginosa]
MKMKKRRIRNNFDAMVSILEIGRTASVQEEMERVFFLTLVMSHEKELDEPGFPSTVMRSFIGCERENQKSDWLALHEDWARVGAYVRDAYAKCASSQDFLAMANIAANQKKKRKEARDLHG